MLTPLRDKAKYDKRLTIPFCNRVLFDFFNIVNFPEVMRLFQSGVIEEEQKKAIIREANQAAYRGESLYCAIKYEGEKKDFAIEIYHIPTLEVLELISSSLDKNLDVNLRILLQKHDPEKFKISAAVYTKVEMWEMVNVNFSAHIVNELLTRAGCESEGNIINAAGIKILMGEEQYNEYCKENTFAKPVYIMRMLNSEGTSKWLSIEIDEKKREMLLRRQNLSSITKPEELIKLEGDGELLILSLKDYLAGVSKGKANKGDGSWDSWYAALELIQAEEFLNTEQGKELVNIALTLPLEAPLTFDPLYWKTRGWVNSKEFSEGVLERAPLSVDPGPNNSRFILYCEGLSKPYTVALPFAEAIQFIARKLPLERLHEILTTKIKNAVAAKKNPDLEKLQAHLEDNTEFGWLAKQREFHAPRESAAAPEGFVPTITLLNATASFEALAMCQTRWNNGNLEYPDPATPEGFAYHHIEALLQGAVYGLNLNINWQLSSDIEKICTEIIKMDSLPFSIETLREQLVPLLCTKYSVTPLATPSTQTAFARATSGEHNPALEKAIIPVENDMEILKR